MEAARVLERDLEELRGRLNELVNENGVISQKRLAVLLGINRTSLNQFMTRGRDKPVEGTEDKLWEWVDSYDARQKEREETNDQLLGLAYHGTKTAYEMISVADQGQVIGRLGQIIKEFKGGYLVTLTGQPGTGKTTICQLLAKLPGVIYIDLWPYMRMGDVLEEIAFALGTQVRGSITQKRRGVQAALKKGKYTLLFDEAEHLAGMRADKLETLRKLADHNNAKVIFVGTKALLKAVDKLDMEQMASRAEKLELTGASKEDVLRGLQAYNIEEEAAQELARIASNVHIGAFRLFEARFRECLRAAQGGRITLQMVKDSYDYRNVLGG